jgi:hypothetical protein
MLRKLIAVFITIAIVLGGFALPASASTLASSTSIAIPLSKGLIHEVYGIASLAEKQIVKSTPLVIKGVKKYVPMIGKIVFNKAVSKTLTVAEIGLAVFHIHEDTQKNEDENTKLAQ